MMRYYLLICVPLLAIALDIFKLAPNSAVKLIVTALVILGFWFAFQRAEELKWQALGFAALTSMAGAFATFLLANNLSLGPVVASGLVGVVGAQFLGEDQQLQLYLGAFVGMSSLLRFPNLLPLAVAGALGGLLWELLQTSWVGVGGRLGTLAATAVLIVLLIIGGGW